MPSVHADSKINYIQNPGFESSQGWTALSSSFEGSSASVQTSAYAHTGNYSGLTQTTRPKQEECTASLSQSLSVSVSNVSTFTYWILKGSSAANGYYTGDVYICMSGGYTLDYYHGFDLSTPPADGASYKYINVGNTATNTWVQVSRNLNNDLVTKFGSTIQSQTITEIYLCSNGYLDIDNNNLKYGQTVYWDDLNLSTVYCTLNFASSTLNGQNNTGTITFAGTTYTLPNSTQQQPGSWYATANPPNGYYFDHWETTGGISIDPKNWQTTTVNVTGTGTLKAVFNNATTWTFMAYLDGDNNLGAPGYDHMSPAISQMESIGSKNGVSIIVLQGKYKPTKGDPVNDSIDYIGQNIDQPLLNLGDTNMADPNTLLNFINWTIHNYPAQRYALILDDHGGGFPGCCIDNWPYPVQYQTGGTGPNQTPQVLSVPQISTALQQVNTQTRSPIAQTPQALSVPQISTVLQQVNTQTGVCMNLLAFDACLMSQVEVVYQFRGLTEVCVASEDVEWCYSYGGTTTPDGWILGNLTANPNWTAHQFGKQMVTIFGNFAASGAPATVPEMAEYDTIAAINMSGITAVAQDMSNIGNWLNNNMSNATKSEIATARASAIEYSVSDSDAAFLDYVDAYNVTQQLMHNVNNSIFQLDCTIALQDINNAVEASWFGNLTCNPHGLSIYFPDANGEYQSEPFWFRMNGLNNQTISTLYNALDMSNSPNTNQWNTFVANYPGTS